MRISDEIRQAVIARYNEGVDNYAMLAQEFDISRRSVGRIIDNYLDRFFKDCYDDIPQEAPPQEETIPTDTKTVPMKYLDLYALGGKARIRHDFNFTDEEADTPEYEVSDYFKQFLDDLQGQIFEISAMCKTLKRVDTPYNLENNRRTLIGLIARLHWYELDTANVKLGIHKAGTEE